jgi:hypothetical protein
MHIFTTTMRLFAALLLAPGVANGFVTPTPRRSWTVARFATIDEAKVAQTDALLETMSSSPAPQQWADMFGLGDSEKGFYALFEGIKKDIPIGLRGKPFVLKGDQVEKAIGASFGGFFTFNDLEKAVNDDFLDAGRGTTDNRKGWKVSMGNICLSYIYVSSDVHPR